MPATLAHIALAFAPGVGRVRFRRLIEEFGSADAVLGATRHQLANVAGVGPAVIKSIFRADLANARQIRDRSECLGCVMLTASCQEFPDSLRNIPDAPVLLFARGDISLLGEPSVAVVGSRLHTAYGRQACERLTAAFARAGLVVVSGMAKGLDAIAHWSALNAGGRSVGVLGNGMGVVYPRANHLLYERMLEADCLVTERPPGEKPTAGSFPERNRIISGLARVTLVIEAGKKSGALITARAALDQGKEVMAVPGPITGGLSVGTNRLIQDGAKPVVEARDVLEEFGVDPTAPGVSLPGNLTPSERQVIELVDAGITHVDDLARHVKSSVSDLLPVLTALEIRGLVLQGAGMHYSKTMTTGSTS